MAGASVAKTKAQGRKLHRCGPKSAQSLNDSPAFSGLSLPICKMRGRHPGPACSYTPWFCDAKWSLKPKTPFLSVLCNSTSEHSIHLQESPPVPTSMSVTAENIKGGENASPVLRESKPRMKTQQTAPQTPGEEPGSGTNAGCRFSHSRLQLDSLLALDRGRGWGMSEMDGSQGLTEVLPEPDPGYDRWRQHSS